MKKLLYIFLFGALTSCHFATNTTPADADSVPQRAFTPLDNDTLVPINLQAITGVAFPKYRILQETPLVPDSASIAAYEETVSSGSFTAVLSMDTIAPAELFHRLDTIRRHDTCWQNEGGTYTYKRTLKGTTYTVVLSRESKAIRYAQVKLQP